MKPHPETSAGMATQFSRLRPLFHAYRRRLLMAVCGVALFNVIAVSPPLIFRYLIDHVVTVADWARLPFIIALYALAPILSQVLQFFNALNIVNVGQRLVADLRTRMYRLSLRLGMTFHGETPAGELVNRVMGDVGVVQQLLNAQTIQLFGDVIVFAVSLIVAFTINAVLATLLVVVVALYVTVYHYFSSRIQASTHSMREVNDLLVGRLQETLTGVRHVRIFTRETRERELYLERAQTGLKHGLASGLNTVGLSASCNVIAGYGSTVIYALAGWYVLREKMTLGELLALNTYVWMALTPALRLTSFAGQFAQIRVSLDRVFSVLSQRPDVASAPDAPDIVLRHGQVDFSQMSFGYAPDKPLFQQFNLAVPAGASVALVGHTGCGKTTLVSLLMRLWDVDDGEISIDGQNIRAVSLSSLRDLFGVVQQQPVIFEGTVAENIAYGKPGASRDEIEQAAQAGEVTQFADRLPDGLDTRLGTYGIQLSVGQKQRVSIARALLKKPAILIMDEATSAIDSEAEAAIQRAIERAMRQCTSFVVAHRLSTIVGADIIVVLDKGKIAEKGSHQDLVKNAGGIYKGLYDELCKSGEGGA
ncbi:MAG: ABC transporter ATP-binding protein [Lentisphaeria bacterium]|nr:ABC transporter ATP-binding protein [Lentisphaeria bacterium]